MCGVFAFLDNNVDPGDRMTLANRMMASIAHRGVRSQIVYTEAGVMGHRRLPIVGIGEDNDQPRTHGQYTVGFVGEVLDFRERYPGMECDTDLVVEKILTDPHGLAGHDGFWGVIVMDNQEQVLHVYTDYLAQKPMYYRTDIAAAASEIEPLRLMADCTFDEVYFAAVVKWGYCPDTTRTPWNEVKHMLPGEMVTLCNYADADTCVAERRIADPLFPNVVTPEEIKVRINRAVSRRVLAADVPLACLVSGGLDSSIVYTLAGRYSDVTPYYAYTNANDMESRAVGLLTDGKPLEMIGWEGINPLDALMVMQEPIDLGSLLPQISLSQGVRETVCLTGDGADELFGGYGRAQRYDSQMSDIYQELVAWHLPRLDRVMMRERVEVRSPFLARDVVQAAMGLPWAMRKDKQILRDLFRSDLPKDLADMPKIPLRTVNVNTDREANSAFLVDLFKGMF
jgi:asparagine synthase (glutamine-hydrolysing)